MEYLKFLFKKIKYLFNKFKQILQEPSKFFILNSTISILYTTRERLEGVGWKDKACIPIMSVENCGEK